MNKKPVRSRTTFTSSIDPKSHTAIKDISDQTDIPISKLLDRAIDLLEKDFIDKGLYTPKDNE